MRLETQRLDMAGVREWRDLAVHNANHGTLCQLLLGGKPMLQLPPTLEQEALARAVERTGVAETVHGRAQRERAGVDNPTGAERRGDRPAQLQPQALE
jgi:hypothetical protein